MAFTNSFTVNKRFSAGVNSFGPLTLPSDFTYINAEITIGSSENNHIESTIVIQFSINGGTTWKDLLTYRFFWDAVINRDGIVGRRILYCNDIPTIYKGSIIKGTLTMNTAARLTFDINTGSI